MQSGIQSRSKSSLDEASLAWQDGTHHRFNDSCSVSHQAFSQRNLPTGQRRSVLVDFKFPRLLHFADGLRRSSVTVPVSDSASSRAGLIPASLRTSARPLSQPQIKVLKAVLEFWIILKPQPRRQPHSHLCACLRETERALLPASMGARKVPRTSKRLFRTTPDE